MAVILISNTTENQRTHTRQHTHSPEGVPTCHTLYWQSPAWMQAIPGTHHRGCSARSRWRLWCCRATSGSSKPVSDNCCFCSRVSSPLLQVFMLLCHYFSSWFLMSFAFIWAVLGKCAQSPLEKPSHAPCLHCCSYLGRWCYPGHVPWVCWASSSNFCQQEQLQTNLN